MRKGLKISKFAVKADDQDLIEIGQFIRDTRGFRVEREWFILFNKDDGKMVGISKEVQKSPLFTFRHPDLMILDKKTGRLLLIIEIDGDIHRIKEFDTDQRNEQYKRSNLPVLVVKTWEVKTTLIDHVNSELNKIFGE